MKLLTDNSAAAELSSVDTENLIISSAYFNKSTGTELVYLQQSFKGLPVLNQIQVLSFKQGQIVSNAGGRIKAIEEKVNTSAIPAVPAEAAVQTAAAAKKIPLLQNLAGIQLSNKIEFGKMGVARENITATLMWVPTEDGKVRLAWQIYLVPKTTPDYFLIRVDAVTNTIISETNLTDYCNWLTPQNNGIVHQHNDGCTETENYLKVNNTLPTQTGPTIINGATYRVIPFPAESPTHPGGAPALRTDPWNAAPGNATTLKWHSTGTVDYTITRGNNVYAQEDLDANNNTPGFSPASTTPDPLTFDFVPNFGVTPTQRTPVPNQQFAITNLFYWNNIIHDVMYQYGFDEVSGNFQANNLGRGGLGNDFVFADAQDGNFVSPNQNNANFSTPADGGNPRMQMYLFDSIITLTVNSPQSIAGSYEAVESGFSPFNKLSAVGPISGQVVYYNDNTGSTHEACVPPSNSLSGKIA
ncbi:MAG: M36 family metallopeptidase, partial [Ferruginibacter sp.]